MINAVIVTVKISGTDKQHDIELPADIPIDELTSRLLIALKNIESKAFLGVDGITIKVDAENRYLSETETLISAGVWDGSIITAERSV
jgi:uncharacterized ubiquitin-like protein YukD